MKLNVKKLRKFPHSSLKGKLKKPLAKGAAIVFRTGKFGKIILFVI